MEGGEPQQQEKRKQTRRRVLSQEQYDLMVRFKQDENVLDELEEKEQESWIRLADTFKYCNGQLFKKSPKGVHKVHVNPAERDQIIRTCHNADAQHGGWHRTYSMVRILCIKD
ncbi:hypothetical protein M1146_03740 [Patescibacteria group bacterium]|nr:hypothetical protein [Patescibacteria group bacterium]